MLVDTNKLPKLLLRAVKAGITSFVYGKSGIGKSDVVRQLADANNLHFIDIRLSQIDPIDLSGIVSVNKEKTKGSYLPMDMFPLEGDALPKGKVGYLLFLDEANQCSKAVASAAFQLTLDRAVGQYKLHKHTAIILAGNNPEDSTVVNKLPAPLLNRLAHFELGVNKTAWIEWADTNKIDYRVKSYINYKPDMLHKYDKTKDDKGWCSPRSWHFASKLLGNEPMDEDTIILLSAVLGEGAAREFFSYTKIFDSLPKLKDILNHPDKAEVTNEPSVNYAVTGLLSHEVTAKNATAIMKYVGRLPIEFQLLMVKAAVRRDGDLLQNDDIVDWKLSNLDSYME